MIAAFEVTDVNPNPARFDHKKAESINGDHIRLLDPADFRARLLPYLTEFLEDPATAEQERVLELAAPLVQERMQLLSEAPAMLGFLFTSDDDLVVEDDALGSLKGDPAPVLQAGITALEQLDDWSTAAIEQSLRTALIDGLGLKPRVAFGPLRVAVSGRRISPPLFESMEILGKQSTLARLRALLAR
jgi:glutamyl-tRNA synthetase